MECRRMALGWVPMMLCAATTNAALAQDVPGRTASGGGE